MKVTKSLKIKLNLPDQQKKELDALFYNYKLGINWCLNEIEKRYQSFLIEFTKNNKPEEAECPNCGKVKKLFYKDNAGVDSCSFCATKMYSEYTVRKEIYGARDRVVEHDLKDVCYFENLTTYNSLFSQAYGMWKSYNGWRTKRLYERNLLETEIAKYPDQQVVKAALLIEQFAADIMRDNKNKNFTWKLAKAHATKKVYSDFSEKEQKEISKMHDKIMDMSRLQKDIKFPQLDECRTVFLNKSSVKWSDETLSMTLYSKKKQIVEYFGRKYLEKYIPLMQENASYCNLTKQNSVYYLLYPLSIEMKEPHHLSEYDTFVIVSSPGKTGIISYDADGMFIGVDWIPTGDLIFAKRHFKEKRSEISRRKYPEEKMRSIRRRKNKIKLRGNVEQRYVSTYNHQLTRKIVNLVKDLSENPKIIIWSLGNGIKQNFGKKLNYEKSMWPAVQQQDYLTHKAQLDGVPVINIKYNLCNNMTCSVCGAVQKNGKTTAKVITHLIKGVKTFKCEECGYEVNMLINQGNNIVSQVDDAVREIESKSKK
ncbi:MAG: hypothetical protein KAS66_04120 [Candidatus Omnitrophica bacterium]|nr:hypothetical protein [Candidatus Omnitrophota bacterium]